MSFLLFFLYGYCNIVIEKILLFFYVYVKNLLKMYYLIFVLIECFMYVCSIFV